MNIILKKQIERRTFLRGMGTVLALPDAGRDDAGVREGGRRGVANADGDPLFPERRPGDHLEHRLRAGDRGAAGNAAVDAGAAYEVPERHHHRERPHEQRRARAGRRPGRSRPRGRRLSDRRASEEDLRQGSPGRASRWISTRRNAVGSATRFASLELGCEEGIQGGNCDNGYSCAYSNSISWRTPNTPNPPEIRPRAVFERLFGIGDFEQDPKVRARQERYQKSVLDSVLADAKRLAGALGADDKRKLDEYHVRRPRHRDAHPEDRKAERAAARRSTSRPRAFPRTTTSTPRSCST